MASMPSRPLANSTFPVGKPITLPPLSQTSSTQNKNNDNSTATTTTTPAVYLVRLSNEVATALTSNADSTIRFSSTQNGIISIPKMNEISFHARPVNNAQNDTAHAFCLSRRGALLRTVGPIIADLDIQHHRPPPRFTGIDNASKKRSLPSSTTTTANNNNTANNQTQKIKPIDDSNINSANNNSKKRPKNLPQADNNKKRPRPTPKRPLSSQPSPSKPPSALASKPVDSPQQPYTNLPLLSKPRPLSQPVSNSPSQPAPSPSSPSHHYNQNHSSNNNSNNHNDRNNGYVNRRNSQPYDKYSSSHAPPPPPPPSREIRSAPHPSTSRSPASPNISPSTKRRPPTSIPPNLNGGSAPSPSYPNNNSNDNSNNNKNNSTNNNNGNYMNPPSYHHPHGPSPPPPPPSHHYPPHYSSSGRSLSNNGNNSGGSGGESGGSGGSGTPSGLGGIGKRKPQANSLSGMKLSSRVSPPNGSSLPRPRRGPGKLYSPSDPSRGPSPADANGSLNNRYYGPFNGNMNGLGGGMNATGHLGSPESPRLQIKPEQRSEMRQHVVHKLAAGERTVDSLRKILKIDEADASSEALKNALNSIIKEVGERRAGGIIHLRSMHWSDVDDNYNGWSESEKTKVRMARASMTTNNNNNNSNNNSNNNHNINHNNNSNGHVHSNSNNNNNSNNGRPNTNNRNNNLLSMSISDSYSITDEALEEELGRFEKEHYGRKDSGLHMRNNNNEGENLLRKKFAKWYPVYKAMVGKMESMRKIFMELEKRYCNSRSTRDKDSLVKKIKSNHEKYRSTKSRMEKCLPAVHEMLKDIKQALDDHAARDVSASGSMITGVP